MRRPYISAIPMRASGRPLYMLYVPQLHMTLNNFTRIPGTTLQPHFQGPIWFWGFKKKGSIFEEHCQGWCEKDVVKPYMRELSDDLLVSPGLSGDSRMSFCPLIQGVCFRFMAPDLVAGSRTGLAGDSKGVMLTRNKGLYFLSVLPDWDAGPQQGILGNWKKEVIRVYNQWKASPMSVSSGPLS